MKKFRRKYFKGRCPNCNHIERLKLINTFEDLDAVKMQCLTCKLMHMYPVERVRKNGRVLTEKQFDKFQDVMDKVLKYSPNETYFVGQEIHHPVFNEVGTVVKKETTEAANKIIIVDFENSGKKKLVEGLEDE